MAGASLVATEVGKLTNGALQWYNKNIGEPLVKTGNPIAKFVAGFGNGSIQVVGAMGQFSVYDTGKTIYTLYKDPQARAQFEAKLENWWNKVRSGDAYTIGQATPMILSIIVNPDDIGAAASKASKVKSLLGKVGTFSKSIVVSSVENAKNLLPKVKSALSDVGTASVTFAKTFGKTFVEESGKYANTCFDVIGAATTGVKIAGKSFVAAGKEAKSVFKVAKGKKLNLEDFSKEVLETKPMNSPIPEKWLKKGGSISIDDDGIWTYTNKAGQSVSYPNGYPDFTKYTHPTVKPVEIEVASPKNPQADFKAANERAGLDKDSNPPVPAANKPPEGYTWHHHEDGKTMLLVDEDIHREFRHIGGQSTINGKNGKIGE